MISLLPGHTFLNVIRREKKRQNGRPPNLFGAVLFLTLPAFFTVQYYYLHCPPFLRCSIITYTARLFYGAVLLLTLPAFFTVQSSFLQCPPFLRCSSITYTDRLPFLGVDRIDRKRIDSDGKVHFLFVRDRKISVYRCL